MAKNIRRMFATVLVMCMIVSALPVQALAAEDETTITKTDTITGPEIEITITPSTGNASAIGTNASGSAVDLDGDVKVTEEPPVTDANGNTTNTTITDVHLEGPETTSDGTKKDVVYDERTTESVTTNSNGDVVGTMWETDGTETKEWTEEDSGDEAGQPKVDVNLVPGETTTGTASTTETTGDVQKGEDDKQYHYTETTTTDRTVTANTSDIVVSESESNDFSMDGLHVEAKPGAEDLYWDADVPMYTKYFDLVTFGDETRYVPRFNRTEDQMCDELLGFYEKVETESTDADGNAVTVTTYVPKAESGKTVVNGGRGGQFVLSDRADASSYTILFADGAKNDACTIGAVDIFGNLLVTYCMDEVTGTTCGVAYVMENLKDADYFEGTEEEQQAAKDQVRAIALKGYWGTTEGMGSLTQIKADLKAFIENNPDFTFTYSDPSSISGGEAKTESKEFNAGADKEYLLQLIEKLNEAGAVTVTQSAIWEFGRGEADPEIVYKNSALESDPEFNYALAMFREYLLNPAIQEEDAPKETIIYDQDSFLVEDSLKLSVGDKIEGSDFNADADDTNDEYNVDLSFKLVVAPGEDDDLIVCLVDNNNTIIRKARIAGEAAEGETSDEIVIAEDGSYTFTNVPLQENSNIAFNLTLEGIQYLEKGVYIYKSLKSDGTADYDYKQTLIGVAQGSHEVDVTTAFTVNFSVDENNYVVSKTVWHDEYDPSHNPSEPPTPETRTWEPPQINRLANDDVVINEEPVPLATPAITGDSTGLWVALFLTVAFAMVAVNLFDKKRKHEAF